MPTLPVPAFPILSLIIRFGIGFILLSIFIRIIALWARMDERFAFIRFLARITDPFLQPIRRIFGTVWMFDLSYIATPFLLVSVQILLLQSLPPGW